MILETQSIVDTSKDALNKIKEFNFVGKWLSHIWHAYSLAFLQNILP